MSVSCITLPAPPKTVPRFVVNKNALRYVGMHVQISAIVYDSVLPFFFRS